MTYLQYLIKNPFQYRFLVQLTRITSKLTSHGI